MKQVAGNDKVLVEFGLRRAQGPDGAMMASQYSYLGGFHGTSNLAAGKAYGIRTFGTMAHAYVCSYESLDEIKESKIKDTDLKEEALKVRKELKFENTNDGELAAFIAYAHDHQNNFVALVDTYNTLNSGVPNFIVVGVALARLGIEPRGIRLDSGDLGELSLKSRKLLEDYGKKANVDFSKATIFASNDINEDSLITLKTKGHAITSYGIGTNLVTCQKQPALGMVYKLVDLNHIPRIKFSEEIEKIPVPGKKNLFRIWVENSKFPSMDILTLQDETIEQGKPFKARDFLITSEKYIVTPVKVESLLDLIWDGKLTKKLPSLHEARDYSEKQVSEFNPLILDTGKPSKYKVLLSEKLYSLVHSMIEENNMWKEI